MKINNIIRNVALLALPLTCAVGSSMLTSCADALDTTSELAQFTDNAQINTPQDSLYHVTGIITQLQKIADRNLLLGELRGDLVVTTDKATKDIKNLAAFDFNEDNKYNQISDYYAVINNCNYFIANADMNLKRLGKVIFEKEFAAISAYRAWTYLQMAKIYGEVPLILTPVLTEEEAAREMQKKPSNINEICEYFIKDIAPYVDTELPSYGQANSFDMKSFFIPVRVLLGELSLWAGKYRESATYFHDYLTLQNHPVPTYTQKAQWSVQGTDFTNGNVATSIFFNYKRADDNITIIPMEENEFYGVRSEINDIFNSTEVNYYYYQAGPSKAYADMSAAENYCYVTTNAEGKRDTIYAPKTNLRFERWAGDLRYGTNWNSQKVNQDEFSKYSTDWQHVGKLPTEFVITYRTQQVYLMFAEALCRAGYPESAFCILKYGLTSLNVENHINDYEKEAAKDLLVFDKEIFIESNTQGIHARGCGDAMYDSLYCMPMPQNELASMADTIQYQIPLVEDMIIREAALEGAYEGRRYYDLMRVALRRNDPAYLAAPIARRNGTTDTNLLNLLMDKQNWYLPKK